jgi:hypothetical protein
MKDVGLFLLDWQIHSQYLRISFALWKEAISHIEVALTPLPGSIAVDRIMWEISRLSREFYS